MRFLFKGVDFFPHDTRWKIIERRYIFIGLSWALAVLSAVLLMTRGLNYGVDFKGGSLIEVQAKSGGIDIGDLRVRLDKPGIGDVQVQAVGTGNEALIRVAQQVPTKDLNEEKVQAAANEKVKGALGENIDVRRIEVVGPTVSAELKRTGVVAVVASMFGILLYVWFRFEWQFAVAAILALAGYSINDTVVVFDRIRENLRRYKRMPLIELLNLSINETLSRTVLTSVTTALAVLALYIFGTAVIHGFSFAMLFGIVIGTYSSIFVAAPFLLLFGVKRDWSGPAVKSSSKSDAAGKGRRENVTSK